MAKDLYHVLEANESASHETLQLLFEQKRARLQGGVDTGDPTAKEQLWALKLAYETLSNPSKRAAYDQSLLADRRPSAPYRPAVRKPELLSWKLNAFMVALLVSGLVGFGLHLGRSNKKDDTSTQTLQITRGADNDATRAGTERIQIEGQISNTTRLIDTQGQVANRIVSVQESAESRASRELEYRANAGAELLRQQQELVRQQQERLRIQNEQLQWERQHADRDQADRRSQTMVANDRVETIQLMLGNGKFVEARLYARTAEERALVKDAERPHCLAAARSRRQRELC